MRRGEKMLFAGGCAVAVLLLWLIWREHDRLEAARERLRLQHERNHALRADMEKWQKALEKHQPARATAVKAPRAATVATPAHVAPHAPKRAATRPWLTRLFAESPYLHRLYLEAHRSELEFEHALTLASLGLTAEERADVMGILARDMERRTDIAAAARGGDLGSANTSIRELHLQQERETAEALRALLGERYEGWHESRGSRIPFVTDVAMHLHRTSTPVTLAQSKALTDLALTSISGRREGANFILPTEADYAAFAEETGRMLVPEQSAVVRGLVEQLSAQRQLDQLRSTKRK